MKTIFMYNKANCDDICTKIKHLSESNFKRNPDIYTVEGNCLFIQTSIENMIQKLVPSRLIKANSIYHGLIIIIIIMVIFKCYFSGELIALS